MSLGSIAAILLRILLQMLLQMFGPRIVEGWWGFPKQRMQTTFEAEDASHPSGRCKQPQAEDANKPKRKRQTTQAEDANHPSAMISSSEILILTEI